MITKKCSWLAIGALAAVWLIGFQTSQAGTVTHVATFQDNTDYSDGGLDLGNLGYVFFNWDQSSATTGDLPQANWNEALPSWITLDLDQTSSSAAFGGLVTSSGGQASWNTLTDPVGSSGLSGSLADPETQNASGGNSNNTIRQWEFTAGVPSTFLLSVVVDNTGTATPLLHAPAGRLRPRLDSGGSVELNLGDSAFNGTADVYQFKIENNGAGDYLKIQLNSGATLREAGIAGLMFDVVPEPASAALLLGGLALSLTIRRRR